MERIQRRMTIQNDENKVMSDRQRWRSRVQFDSECSAGSVLWMWTERERARGTSEMKTDRMKVNASGVRQLRATHRAAQHSELDGNRLFEREERLYRSRFWIFISSCQNSDFLFAINLLLPFLASNIKTKYVSFMYFEKNAIYYFYDLSLKTEDCIWFSQFPIFLWKWGSILMPIFIGKWFQ